MRSLRLVAALGLGLTPLLGSAAAGTVPAFAGGGAGMTLTATMEGQDQRLLVGTRHLVTITVADTPGEADLRDIWVGVDDLDPHPLPVTCPTGENGHLSLEPQQSLQCTAVVTAEVGYRTLVARARARVPGSDDPLVRSTPLHYTGFLPPPPPPPPAAHAALKGPLTSEPAASRPHPAQLAPPAANQTDPPADPPAGAGGEAADPPAGGCPDGKGGADAADGCCTNGKPGSGGDEGCCPDGKAGAGATGATGAAAGCCAGGKNGSSTAAGCCAGGKAGAGAASGCCDRHDSAAGCAKPALGPAGGSHKNGILAFTGMSAPMLGAAAAIGLGLVTGGALLVRRDSRRG